MLIGSGLLGPIPEVELWSYLPNCRASSWVASGSHKGSLCIVVPETCQRYLRGCWLLLDWEPTWVSSGHLGSDVVDAKYRISEVVISDSVERGGQINLLRSRNNSLSPSGPVAILLCVYMFVCTHMLEIDTPMVPEAPEQALNAGEQWPLE